MGDRGQFEAAGSQTRSGSAATGSAVEAGSLTGLTMELRALREEIRDLRVLVLQLASAPAAPAAAAASRTGVPADPRAQRQAEQLASEVHRRRALGGDPGQDTELDLLIDRLHDLALEAQP